MKAAEAGALMTAVARWAARREDIRAMALVGSWARGDAGPASDLDLILLSSGAEPYRVDTAWLDEIDWGETGFRIHVSRGVDYGAVWSWHVLLYPVAEVELSFADCDWGAAKPLSAGTRRVIKGGIQVIFDKDGILAGAIAAVSAERRDSMLRAIEHRHAANWPAAEATDSLTLDYDNRHRRRIRLMTDAGAALLLDLPKAVAMAHGDGLLLEDGRWIEVKSAPEPLIELRSADAARLARIAWHIGNRHCAAQILDGAIRIRPDHVMETMVAGLGGMMTRIEAPFQPEGGAYGGEQAPGDGHHPHEAAGHSHDHSHGGHHAHSHDHGHGHGGQHAHSRGHDHTHDQGHHHGHGDAHDHHPHDNDHGDHRDHGHDHGHEHNRHEPEHGPAVGSRHHSHDH